MVRTRIETFIYSVIDRVTKQVIGSFESNVELKPRKRKRLLLQMLATLPMPYVS